MYEKIALIVCLLLAVESSDARNIHRWPKKRSGSNQPPADLSPDSGAGPSAECVSGLSQVMQQCSGPPSLPGLLGADSSKEIYDRLVEVDLRELCSPYQQWFQCFSNAMDACKAENDPASRTTIQGMDMAEAILNYGCVQEVDVLNRHKACLLKLDDDIPDSHSREVIPVIATSLNRSCYEQIKQLVGIPGEFCLRDSRDLQACAKQLVAEQCGDEIASVLDGLVESVRTATDCPSLRMRSIGQLKRRGFSSFTHHFNFLKSFF